MHKYLRYRSIFSLFLLFKLQKCTVIPLWNRWWREEKKMVTLDSSRGKKISGMNSNTLIHIHIYLIWMFIMSTLAGYFALPVLPVVLWTLFMAISCTPKIMIPCASHGTVVFIFYKFSLLFHINYIFDAFYCFCLMNAKFTWYSCVFFSVAVYQIKICVQNWKWEKKLHFIR